MKVKFVLILLSKYLRVKFQIALSVDTINSKYLISLRDNWYSEDKFTNFLFAFALNCLKSLLVCI